MVSPIVRPGIVDMEGRTGATCILPTKVNASMTVLVVLVEQAYSCSCDRRLKKTKESGACRPRGDGFGDCASDVSTTRRSLHSLNVSKLIYIFINYFNKWINIIKNY